MFAMENPAHYSAAEPEALGRISVAGVTTHQGSGAIEVEVRLTSGSLEAQGRAFGANTRFDTRRVVGEATLDAISKLVAGDPGLSLGEMEEKNLGSTKVLLVCVNRVQERIESHFMGCSEIGYDPTLAAIHAVLDAVNRFVGTLGPREPLEYRIGPAPVEG
jgi:hypothetical protein